MQAKSSLQQVRIIGGQWKRTPISVVDVEGLRPTPDRVRETVFNWLNFLFQSNWSDKCSLDLFAGSGALSWEAASRGAQQVTLVEKHPKALGQLNQLKAKLNAQQVNIIKGDALTMLRQWSEQTHSNETRVDVIFLDPPFHQGLLEQVVPLCKNLLKADGLIYIESEKLIDPAVMPDFLKEWQVIRQDKAGKVFFHLLSLASVNRG